VGVVGGGAVMTERDYWFAEQYRMSEGVQTIGSIEDILLEHIPGAERVERAKEEDDKKGTDYWVYRKGVKKPVGIDVKIRSIDPIMQYSMDDLALEIWSVIDRNDNNKIGWTLDNSKETDFILWFFEPTKRFVLLPFLHLLAVTTEHMPMWEKTYKVSTQGSDDKRWRSMCVFVPRKVVLGAITARFYGDPQ
jgi:hypothetical protein